MNVAKKIVRDKLSYEIKISTSLKTGVMAPGHDHLDEKIIEQSFFFTIVKTFARNSSARGRMSTYRKKLMKYATIITNASGFS